MVVEASRYAVPLSSVERVLPMVAAEPVPGAPQPVLGAINLEGRVVPVMDPRRRLGLAAQDYGLEAHLLVVRTPRRTLALAADEVLGVQEIDEGAVTAADAVIPHVGRVTGIAALPDGLVFIHDLEGFLTPEEDRQLEGALQSARAWD
jgi:purine-binding chemotaxis protein CheW